MYKGRAYWRLVRLVSVVSQARLFPALVSRSQTLQGGELGLRYARLSPRESLARDTTFSGRYRPRPQQPLREPRQSSLA